VFGGVVGRLLEVWKSRAMTTFPLAHAVFSD
jgi:hypothetical protein